MCHHPKRFSEDCVDFNMHEEKEIKELEKPTNQDGLEEAADEYSEKHGFRVPYDGSNNFYDEVDVKASKEGFIAGAKWMANQMPMPEDTVLFQKGVEEGRRLEKDEHRLTWEDMVLLRTLFDATDANQSMGALTVQPMTREYYEYLLREFNEQRKR